MKNRTIVFMTLIFQAFFFPFPLHAQLPSAVSVPASAAVNQIGVVAAVRGSVQITTPGQVGRVAGSGQPVYLGDEVKTDAAGHLQIMLLDETVFTIGPNSSMAIDKFVYDPATRNGEVKAKILKGTFRFVTGKIAHKKPANMTVELPSGTIGIRGTIVIGNTDGNSTTAALMGPGANNNAGYADGGFFMQNQSGGQTFQTDINTPGFGATIPGSGQPPSGAFHVGDDLLNQWSNDLNPPSGGNDDGTGGGDNANDSSGQSTAGGGDSANVLGQVNGLAGDLGLESDQMAQYIGDNSVNGVLDGIATYEQLRTLSSQNSGVAHWEQSGLTLYDSGGNDSGNKYNFYYDIDFGSRQVGNGNSRVEVVPVSASPISLPVANSTSFASGTGPASFSHTLTSNGGWAGSLNVDLNNSNGVIADTATHSVILNQSANTYKGSGTTDSRQTGASEPFVAA